MPRYRGVENQRETHPRPGMSAPAGDRMKPCYTGCMDEPDKPVFTIIKGGRDELEHNKRLLYARPWSFDSAEFDRLSETIGIGRADAFDLTLARLRHKARESYEAAAVLAIFEGSDASEILALGRRREIRLETSEPPAPPRSTAPGDATHS